MIRKDAKILARLHREASRCEMDDCSRQAKECHHIKPRGHGGGSRLDVGFNLVMLCVECHALAQRNEIPRRALWGIAAEREVYRLLRQLKSPGDDNDAA